MDNTRREIDSTFFILIIRGGLKVKLVKQFNEHQKTADKGGCDVMRKRIYQN